MPTAPPVPRLLGAARVAIVLSALAAPAVHAVLATHQPAIPWLTAAGMALGIAGGLMAPGWTLGALVALAPVWQAVIGAVTGETDIQLVMPWLAAMAGGLAVAAPSRWRAGAIWAVPLSAWALVIALTWPVAMLRELDFATAAFTGRGAGPSPLAATLVIPAAEAQLVSLLFFDWLFGADDDDRRLVWRWLPPAIGVVCALAVWQAAVDPALLSRRPWIGLGRAAGGFYDANATGALAALFGPLLTSGVIATSPPSWRRAAFWSLLSLAAVLASGSRTSMAAWTAASAAAWMWTARRSWRTALAAAAGAAAVIAIVAALRVPGGEGQFGAAARLGATARTMLAGGSSGLVNVLWYRYGYGPASMQIIAERPWWGIGPGVFGTVVGHYSPPELGFVLPPDNAQNWWRHQWAELGLIGALPAFVCSLLAMAAGLRAWRSPAPAWALPILGLGVLSLVSPPVQHPFLQVLVALLIAGAATAADPAPGATRRPASALWGPIVWVAAVACAGGLAVDGWTTFRPAYRAARFKQLYTYGLTGETQTPFGVGRWAATRAVGVFAPPTGSDFVLNILLPHEDLADRPVHVVVSGRRGPLCAWEISDRTPVSCRLPAEPDAWLLAQLDVSRAWTDGDGHERAAFLTGGLLPP